MTNVSEVAEGIYMIETDAAVTTGSLGLPRSSIVYFIATEPSAIIETGPTVAVPSVLEAILQLGHDTSSLSCAILTHIHLDHAGGAGTLARLLPNTQVLVHDRGIKYLVDTTRLIEATRQAFGEKFEDEYGPIRPVPESQVRVVMDGETIWLGDRELKIVYAPGHAPHQLCVYDTKSRGVFSGEALGTPQSNVVSTVAGFDPDVTLETIDRIAGLAPEVVFCSHGGVSRDATRLIQSLRVNMKAYSDIILAAMKAREVREQIVRRLEDYRREYSPDEGGRGEPLDSIITWHMAYFKRKGIA
jgi:glyoxylase-like metal-dependent hydrolase (beta-lactamase superfamily II)